MNELQAQIRERTHKMMAVVAELSMRQAECMTLEQQMKEKELLLDLCHRRVEQGLPPSDNIENEWLRYLRDKHRRQGDAEKKARVSLQMPSKRHNTNWTHTTGTHDSNLTVSVFMRFDLIWTSRSQLVYVNSSYRYKVNVSDQVLKQWCLSISVKPSNDSWIVL